MRVGFGVTVLKHGLASGHIDGIGTYTKHLHDELIAAGCCTIPFAFNQRGNDADSRALGPFHKQLFFSALCNRSFTESDQAVKECSVFHATDHHIPKLGNVPLIATVMDTIPLVKPEWVGGNPRLRRFKNWLFKRTVNWADLVVTISEYSAEQICHYFEVRPERVKVVHLGYDVACRKPVNAAEKQAILDQYGLEPGYFFYIGTLQPRKNLTRLIQAHQRLPSSVRRKHPLVIAGQRGWGCDELVSQLEQQYFPDVHWLQYLPKEHKYAVLQGAQAMVFPSLYEGFGLPVVEGFAARVPVLTSNTTSLPEVAGNAALYVNPEAVTEITEGLESLTDNSHQREQLVAAGDRRIELFSWQETARQMLQIYRSAA